MRFIKPKDKKVQKVNWEISEQTIDLVKAYAEYTDYSETEVVEFFLRYIREDKDFHTWATKKRNNKKLLKLLELQDNELGETTVE
ncbi:hypothetical protein [Ureibacillus endophyticus]|uniref:Uncharacterized protein n=1 Tax=Ureibacillus endophyticus TaxID=1978490 RepID=A0A494YVE5_9BACL|nr:hypothetical protein [Lysinibacillus endophyticus]RKQ14105.1 hypothetical protein D8M03_14670 [Lysinibacillus endophyticus]